MSGLACTGRRCVKSGRNYQLLADGRAYHCQSAVAARLFRLLLP